jgi:hypothetical protein
MEAANFCSVLGPMGISVAHIIVNRVRPPLRDVGERPTGLGNDPTLDERVATWDAVLENLAHRQAQAIDALEATGAPGLIRLDELRGTIHSLEGLSALSEGLRRGN